MTTHDTSRLSWTTGQWLALIILIHTMFGIAAGIVGIPEGPAAGRSPFAEIWQLGVFGSIEPDMLRALWFWFTWFGFATAMAAFFMHKLERLHGPLSTSGLMVLLALGLSGVCMIPVSGFWFLVILAAVKLWRQRHIRTPDHALTSS